MNLGRPLAAALLLLALAAATVSAEPCPEPAEPGSRRQMALPQVLSEPEVRRNLDSGLTTTFVLRLQPRGKEPVGGARLEIRYEPWDQVYHVRARGSDGESRRRTLRSFDELQLWWRALRLPVLAADAESERLRLVLDVIPFSAAEERDAERWLAGKLSKAASGRRNADDVGQGRDETPEALSQTLNALIATSIRRDPLQTFRWVCEPEEEGR